MQKVIFLTIFLMCLLTFSTASYAVVTAEQRITCSPLGTYGSAPSECYSYVGGVEDYDAGNHGFPASTNIDTALGNASSSATSPMLSPLSLSVVSAQAESYTGTPAGSWASVYGRLQDNDYTATFTVHNTYEFDPLGGSGEQVRFYVGLWAGTNPTQNLLLSAKGDWTRYNIGTEENPIYALTAVYTSGSLPLTQTSWTLGLQGANYTFYNYAETTAVPEPASLLLVGLGIVALRRKR